MWYLRLIKKGWEDFVKKMAQEKSDLHKALAKHLSGLRVTENLVEDLVKNFNEDIETWDDEILLKIASELRKQKNQ